MGNSEILDSNLVKFVTDRRRTEDPYVSELLKGLVSGFRELEHKNRELEQRNMELLAELQETNARMTKLGETPTGDADASKAALNMAAEILVSAEDIVSSIRLTAKTETSSLYEDVTRRVMEAQNEVLALLQRTRDENTKLNQEASERSINVLMESKRSILAMAESLDRIILDRMSPPPPSLADRATPTPPVSGVDPREQPADSQYGEASGKAGYGRLIMDAKSASSHNEHSTLASKVAEALQVLNTTNGTNGRSCSHEEQEIRSYLPREDAKVLRTDDEAVEPAPFARSVRLVAVGLNSFSDLMSFHRAVQKLPGVLAVQAESFHSGTIRLLVRYQSAVQLDEMLSEMTNFELQRVSSTRDQIDVAVVCR